MGGGGDCKQFPQNAVFHFEGCPYFFSKVDLNVLKLHSVSKSEYVNMLNLNLSTILYFSVEEPLDLNFDIKVEKY